MYFSPVHLFLKTAKSCLHPIVGCISCAFSLPRVAVVSIRLEQVVGIHSGGFISPPRRSDVRVVRLETFNRASYQSCQTRMVHLYLGA
jgi:hypothetical protein